MDQANGLRRIARSGLLGHPPLRVYAVTSGKGGVGKTNISVNLAVLAARAGRRVLLVDADLGLANVDVVLGLKPRHHFGHVLEGSMPIEKVLVEGPHGIRILPAASGVQSLTQLTDEQKLHVLSALDPLDEMFDIVLIDSGAGIGDNTMFFVGAAQEAILVVNAEPTSLVDGYAALKTLSSRAGVRQFAVVVNSVVDELAAREVFRKLCGVAGRFLPATLRHLGYVPRDENVQRAVMAQRPVSELFPSTPASRALSSVAKALLDGPQPACSSGLGIMRNRLLAEEGVGK